LNYNNTDTLFNNEITIVIIAIIIAFFVFLGFFINLYLPLKEDIKYIKIEMERSFEEEEYLFWKRKLINLYLKSIPLIGRFFK